MNVSQSCSPSRFDIKEEVASSLCRLYQNMCQSHITCHLIIFFHLESQALFIVFSLGADGKLM